MHRLKDSQNKMHSSCSRLTFRPTETFSVIRRRQNLSTRLSNCAVRHGLSHREATATDLLIHCLTITYLGFSLYLNVSKPSSHPISPHLTKNQDALEVCCSYDQELGSGGDSRKISPKQIVGRRKSESLIHTIHKLEDKHPTLLYFLACIGQSPSQ